MSSIIDWTEYQRLSDSARRRFANNPGLLDYALDSALTRCANGREQVTNINVWARTTAINYYHRQAKAESLDMMHADGFDVAGPEIGDSEEWAEIDRKLECSCSDPQRALYLQAVAHLTADGYTVRDIAARIGGSIMMVSRARQRLAVVLA